MRKQYDKNLPKQKLNASDHELLLCLIHGKTIMETAVVLSISHGAINARLVRIKKCMECKTIYQCVAIEMVNLLFKDEPNEILLVAMTEDDLAAKAMTKVKAASGV